MQMLLLGAVVAMTACGKSNEAKPPKPETKPIAARLSSTISKTVGDSWSANDKIGVFMISGESVGSSTIVDGADNIPYIVAEAGTNGVFSPVTESQMIMLPQDGSSVAFVAYYPYAAALTNYALGVNLAEQSNQEAIDIMSAKMAGVNETKPQVTLTFTRAMSKILVKTTSDVYTSEQMAGVRAHITTLNTTGAFLLTNMGLSSLGNPANISLKTTTAGVLYEGTVFPSTTVAAGGAKIVFMVDGKQLEYTITTTKFTEGQRYTYELKLGRTSVTRLNSTITDWVDDPTNNNGTAE